MSPAFWADFLVIIHGAFVAFVVFGELLIVVGIALRWKWIRNLWFRIIHLLAISVVAIEALANVECPLTVWERDLRMAAGQPVSDASFVGRIFHNVLFYEGIDHSFFQKLHIGFGVLVLLTFVIAPPRWPFGKGDMESEPCQ